MKSIYLVSLLLFGLSAKAQVVMCVDTVLLYKAAHELVLFDSLKKDYAEKDSLVRYLKELDSSRVNELADKDHQLNEKTIQVDLYRDSNNILIRENNIRINQGKKYRRQRNGALVVAGGLLVKFMFFSK